MSNKQLLEKAKKLKAELIKRHDVLGAIENGRDLDEFENVEYAIQQMDEVIDALECNDSE